MHLEIAEKNFLRDNMETVEKYSVERCSTGMEEIR